MNQVIINGYSREGLEVLIKELNILLLKRENLFKFSGVPSKPLSIKPEMVIILQDLLSFVNDNIRCGSYNNLDGWKEELNRIGGLFWFKVRIYFKDFPVQLKPILGD